MVKNLKNKNGKGPGGPLVISLLLIAPSILNVILWNMFFFKRLDFITDVLIFLIFPAGYWLSKLWEKLQLYFQSNKKRDENVETNKSN
ncbi:hypothetical protein HOB87_13620 [Candidatus Woesearchaeota archaeon]|jgi:hypothetical protein|nr:hypothetical protein [Candidatus Woesearchaeota archaeon]